MEDEADYIDRLERWKYAVVGALNPMRPGDDVRYWGHDLGDPAVAVRCIESIRAQRDAAEAKLARESRLLVECIKTRGELGERMITAEAKLAKVGAQLAERNMMLNDAEAKLARATALLKTFYSDAYIEEILAAAKGE